MNVQKWDTELVKKEIEATGELNPKDVGDKLEKLHTYLDFINGRLEFLPQTEQDKVLHFLATHVLPLVTSIGLYLEERVATEDMANLKALESSG
jgi:hypothetical protein